VKYGPDDGLFGPKLVGNTVNTPFLINIMHLLVLYHCALMYKIHGKTYKNTELFRFLRANIREGETSFR
jgi:hypothetical protein